MAVQVLRKVLKAVVGYLAAAYLALVLSFVVYGLAVPQGDDLQALRRSGVTGPVVLVGLLVAEEKTPYAMRFEDRRYYAALPASVSGQVLWVVVEENLREPVIRRSSVAFWALLVALAGSLLGVWWCWLRPGGRSPRNGSPEPTRRRDAT